MKEQILVFFSNFSDAGIILDYSRGGELQIDIEEGGCFDTGDLMLENPEDEVMWYGLWLWEGMIGVNKESEIDYLGDWRRLTAEEIVMLVRSRRVTNDISEDISKDEQIGESMFNMLLKGGLSN